MRSVATGILLSCATTLTLGAQGYRLRLDSRVQAVAYRGVTLDSVAANDSVTAAGYALQCNPTGFCTFYRPGPIIHAVPVTTTADVTVWGLGVPGLSVRAIGRTVGDLSSGDNWPGTAPRV